MNKIIKFDNVSKKYKLYSKGGLYLRDRITHAISRVNPFNRSSVALGSSSSVAAVAPLERDFWALKNVSFTLEQGQSIAFIGRNGAGKSTILKLLAGVTDATSGKVKVEGRVAALIEVGAGFHPELTGRENIYLNGSIFGMKKTEIDAKFDSIVSYAEVEDFIDTPVKHYSSGMYVRLGFAIAAHTEPDVYLVDEVLAVGDAAFQKKCLGTLEGHRSAGKTMVLVSHDLSTIREVCDRCVYVSHGEVLYDGTPSEVIAQYQLDMRAVSQRSAELAGANGASGHAPSASGLAPVSLDGKESVSPDGGKAKGFWLHVKKADRVIAISCGDPIELEFEVEAPEPIPETMIGITLVDVAGDAVVSMSSKLQNLKSVDGVSRVWKVACNMGAIPLNAGTYFTRVHVGDRGSEYCKFSNVFAIKVAEKDVFGCGKPLPDSQSWGPLYWAPEWDIAPE